MWRPSGATVTLVAAAEVVYGEPTDSSHCTAGATGYTAALTQTGTVVEVVVNANDGAQTMWYVYRDALEGQRF